MDVIESDKHDIEPEPGTVYSEQGGQPATVMNHDAYPLVARCRACKGPIRSESFWPFTYEWWAHLPE